MSPSGPQRVGAVSVESRAGGRFDSRPRETLGPGLHP